LDDKTIRLWDANNDFKCTRIFEDHKSGVTCLLSVNEQLLSGSNDKTIRVWDMYAKCLAVLQGHTNTVNCITDIDEFKIATGGKDNKVRIWSLINYNCLKVIDCHTGSVNSILFHYGKIITTSFVCSVRIFEIIEDYKCNNVLKSHQDPMENILLMKDGKIVGGYNALYIWG
jgi:WD40 repeat protein